MKPKFRKLITLLLLISIFALLVSAEMKVSVAAKEELSKWASWLPEKQQDHKNSINPYSQEVSITEIFRQVKQEINFN